MDKQKTQSTTLSDGTFSAFQTALTVLPILIAGLYLLGLTFHQGFLEGFGIEETLFPLSVDRTLFQGFVALMTLGATPAGYSLIAGLAILTTTILAAAIASSQRVRSWSYSITTKLHRRSKQTSTIENIPLWQETAVRGSIYLIAAFFIYLLLLTVVLAATKSGKEQALQFIENSEHSKEGFVTLYISNGSESIFAKPILCGSSHCAFWLGSNAVLYKNDSVEKVETSKRDSQRR